MNRKFPDTIAPLSPEGREDARRKCPAGVSEDAPYSSLPGPCQSERGSWAGRVGRGERGDVLLLGQLLQAGHQDFAADLVLDLLPVEPLDQLSRRLARAEPLDVRAVLRDQFAVFLVQPGVDVGAIDRDLDVFLDRKSVV